jgi:hypothetical protein
MFLKVVRAKNCWLIRNEETNETKEEIYVVPEQVPCNSFDKADRHTRLQCAQYLSERNNTEQVHKNLVILENKWIKNNHPLKGKKIATSSTQINFLIASAVPSNHPTGSSSICVAANTCMSKKRFKLSIILIIICFIIWSIKEK